MTRPHGDISGAGASEGGAGNCAIGHGRPALGRRPYLNGGWTAQTEPGRATHPCARKTAGRRGRYAWTARNSSAVGAVPPRWAGSHQESSGSLGRPG